MPEGTIKIHGAKFVVTVDPERRIIQNGSVLLEGQRIVRVGKAFEMEDVTADRVIDASEMVVTPGFCNGHMHISYAHATRGIFPDDLGPDYLPNVFKLQAAMNEEEEYYTSLLGITELLKYGTTCFMDPGSTKYLDACMDVYEKAGCRIVSGAHVSDLPNPVNVPVYGTSEAVSIMEKTIREFNGRLDGRMTAWAMPFSADFSTEELLVAAKRIADENGVGMTLHQANGPGSVRVHEQRFGKRPVQHLEDIGVVGSNVLLAHVIELDDNEVDILARTDTRAIMCPTQSMKQATGVSQFGKLPEMLEKGVTVGLGTDAGNNSNLVEVLRSMYLVSLIYKDGRRDVSMIPPETALEMATIQGARALGLDSEIGSIEEGKKADLVLFDTRRPEWRTLVNPINNLVYNADGRSVHTVIVDGRVVVDDYKTQFVNEWELIQKVQELGEGLMERTGVSFPSKWPLV